MEEIDIIELLKRVKEGKAPKEIMIDNVRYKLNGERDELDETDVSYLYLNVMNGKVWIDDTQPSIFLNTKIKILDKPIIEELKVEEGHTDFSGLPYTVYPTKDEIIEKINQIIRHINKEEN